MAPTHFILVGHGRYASGLMSAALFIGGPRDTLHAIDFCEGESDEDLAEKVEECVHLLPSDAPIIFIGDLLGGSPYKKAATYVFADPDRFQVVLGVNLGGLLDTLLKAQRAENADARFLADNMLEASKKNLFRFEPPPATASEPAEGGI